MFIHLCEPGSPDETHNGGYMAAMTKHNRNQMRHITQSPERSINTPLIVGRNDNDRQENISLSLTHNAQLRYRHNTGCRNNVFYSPHLPYTVKAVAICSPLGFCHLNLKYIWTLIHFLQSQNQSVFSEFNKLHSSIGMQWKMNQWQVIFNAQQYHFLDLQWRRFKDNDHCDLGTQSYNSAAKWILRGDGILLVKTAICCLPVIFMWPFISSKRMFYSIVKLQHPSHTLTAHARHERRRIQLKSKVIILRWWQHCLKMTLDFNVVQVNFGVWKDLWEDNAGPIYTQLKCVFPFESAPIPSWLNEQPVLNVACCAERISVAMLQSHSETGGQTKWPSESWLFCKGESIKMIFRFTKQRRIITPLAVQRFRLFFARCNVCLTAL